MSDFEIMLLRKKEERTRRKKRRDIDIINDNDDLIAQLLQNMKTAAEVGYINLFFNIPRDPFCPCCEAVFELGSSNLIINISTPRSLKLQMASNV